MQSIYLCLNNTMNSINIKTSQNVQINYQLASIGDRILATLIDSIIIFGYFLLMGFIMSIFSDVIFDDFDALFIDGIKGMELTILLLIFLLFSPALFYHLLCELTLQGQSFGKRAMQIKVVKADGSQPKFGNYLLRWMLRIIDSIPYWGIGICSILFSKNSQRLGDLAAGTIVIKLKPEVQAEDTIFAQIDENHQVQYKNVLRLTDRDVELIKSIMNSNNDKPEMISKLAHKIRSVIDAPEDGLLPVPFLKQVLKDYNYSCVFPAKNS